MFRRTSQRFPKQSVEKTQSSDATGLSKAIDKIKKSEALNRQELQEHQLRALQKIVEDAYFNVPLYWNKYHEADFDPYSVNSLQDLSRIPMVTKADLRNAGIGSVKNFSRREPVWVISSSGSTGKPSQIFREEQALWQFMARSLILYRDWCHGKPLANALYITDLAPGSVDFVLADLLRTMVLPKRILGSNLPTQQLIDALLFYRPEYLSTYPSTIRNISIALHQKKLVFAGLKLLHLTSEMLDSKTRKLIAQVLPSAQIVETYTSSEAGLMAYTCPKESQKLHIAEAEVILETMDPSGKPTAGMGQCVVTDLVNHSTPIIRYTGLGDFISLDSPTESDLLCPCGSCYRSIRKLEGRVADSIWTESGKWISPYLLIDAIEELPGIYQFQIIQISEKKLIVKIHRDSFSRCSESELTALIVARLANFIPSANIHVEYVSEILSEGNRHKVPLVISHISNKG